MRSAALWGFQIPMEAGVVLRHQRLKQREGMLIRLTQAECVGWGEISPLPGFSRETLQEARQQVDRWLEPWLIGDEPPLPELPSAAFGLSCALAERDGVLPLAADYRAAALCTGDTEELVATLAGCTGEKVAKVKVGLYDAAQDGMVVNQLLETLPDLRLRLDANRSWTPLKAQQFAQHVNPHCRSRIAFIEEPCQTREQSSVFSQETGIAIAWDESLREEDFRFSAEQGVAAVIIKPMLTGSLQKVRDQVYAAHRLGLKAVVSSSIESSFGLTQLARLAAWLTPDTIPGLDTLSLMQTQLERCWPGSSLPCLPVDALERIR